MLDIVSVIAEVGPRLAIGVFAELGVYCGDVGGSINIGDVIAKVEEVCVAIGRVPIEFLPRYIISTSIDRFLKNHYSPSIRWVIHGTPEWKGDCHGEITIICESLEAEDGFEFIDRFLVICSDQCVEFVDNGIDTRNAVLRSVFLNWCIPLGISEHCMYDSATSDSSVKQVSILLYGEGSLSSRQTSSVQYPWSTWC